MAPRSRILAFGSATALVVAGGVSAATVGGVTGQVLTIVLISAGLGGALLLVFLEVGLGEERERTRDEERQRRGGTRASDAPRRLRLRAGRRRPR